MDTRFLGHNLHLTSVATFEESDPQLSRLNKQSYIYYSPLLERLPVTDPGIYTLGGGRQIGKSTLLKQWMLKLLRDFHVEPQKIAFFTGEIIDDHHSLLSLLQSQLGKMQCDHNNFGYVIIDEITYIKNWDKAIKYAADLGYFENVILILTGSDLILMQAAKMRFPGRRGKADLVDFHMYPLSFKEVLNLKNITNITHIDPNLLLQEFLNYLQHGGYLMAINDLKSYGKILPATFQTYADWIRGDILKKGKQESYLREIIGAIIKRYGSQITWNSLAKDLSIDHHKTVADYIELLVSMDVVFIQSALIEDKLVGAPKKAKKLMFIDPFIFHALNYWIDPATEPYINQVKVALTDNNRLSKLIEAVVTTTIKRKYPTYYIKSDGEVDIAYIQNNKFWPIEIKWTSQIRTGDLKQIAKYSNSQIWCKQQEHNTIHGVPTVFLPLALALFD